MDMPPVIGIDTGWLLIMFLWFSCGWFFVYVILGPWFKVKLVNLRIGGDLQKNKRLLPVFISHLLFSLAMVNPFALLVVTLKGEDISFSWIWGVVLFTLYLGLLPIFWECLLLRFVSRLKGLKWLRWKPPLKRVVLVSLLLSMVSFSAGYGAIRLSPATPTIVTTFNYYVRGKGYISVDTPGVILNLYGGWLDEADVASDEGPAKVNARIYSPEYMLIEAKQNDDMWRINSSGQWGKLANIKVKNKETTRLELGPPFLIKTTVSKSDSLVLINLLIIGRAGEHYSAAIMRNGKTIARPELKIVDEAGKLLASDKFRYG
jgi:hypothetical protein